MKLQLAVFSLILILVSPLKADVIRATKNNKVLILMETDGSLSVGDKVFAVDENGKKKALITIEKVKGAKAFGTIQKGRAAKDMTIQAARARAKTAAESRKERLQRAPTNDLPFSWGVLGGLGLDSMSVKLTDANGRELETISMSGTGFSVKALVDYNFSSAFGVRLIAGMEQFSTTGTAKGAYCDGSEKCKTNISYITLDALMRYAFVDSETKVWLGGGVGFWMPGSKSTNTLDANSIGTTSAVYGALGVDFSLGEDSFIPAQVDYALLPSSNEVAANAIAFRVGMAWRF